MKKSLLFWLVACFCMEALGATKKFQLVHDWHAVCYPEDTARYGDSIVMDNVSLPHNFDDYYVSRHLNHGNLHGKVVYDFDFNAMYPAHDADLYYRLRIEGAGTYLTVILNEDTLCTHRPAGRVTTTLPINAEHVYDFYNHLRIICEHPSGIKDMPWQCGGCNSEGSSGGENLPMGLFRGVYLDEMYGLHIQPYGVHTWTNAQCDTLFVETEVENLNPVQRRKFELHTGLHPLSNTSIKLAYAKTIFKLSHGRTTIVRQAIPVENIIQWTPSRPYMYVVRTSLVCRDYDSGQRVICDMVDTEFGFRNLQWDNQLKINGTPIQINSLSEDERGFGHDYALSHLEVNHRSLQLRRMGFNAFREEHHPHNLRYLHNWNRLGIMNWTQFSDHVWQDTPAFRKNFKTLLRQWVKERRNDPSVVRWGLQNGAMLPADFVQECAAIIREMDPTGRQIVTNVTDSLWRSVNYADLYATNGQPTELARRLVKDSLSTYVSIGTAALLYRGVEGMSYLYRYNCGGDSLVDSWGHLWMGDDTRFSSSWSQRPVFAADSLNPMLDSYGMVDGDVCVCLPDDQKDRLPDVDQPLMRSFRWGRKDLKFRFPVAPHQNYTVDVYSVEPWENIPGGRVCTTAINGTIVDHDKDACYISGGRNRLIRTSYHVNSKDTSSLEITFPRVISGQAVVSAIAISTLAPIERDSIPSVDSVPGYPYCKGQTWKDLNPIIVPNF